MSVVPLLRAVVGVSHRLRDERVAALEGDWPGRSRHLVEPAGLEDIILGMETPSLFGEDELLVIRADDRYLRRHGERLAGLVGRSASAGALVLVTDKLAKNTRLGKALARADAYLRVEEPGAKTVESWLVDRLRALPVAVERPARVAQVLIEHRGHDPDALLAGLDVALLHGAEDGLRAEDVAATVGDQAERPIWEFTGAVLTGEVDRALELIRRDRDLNAERALNAVAGEVRKRLCCLETDDDAEVWRLLGGRRGGSLYYSRRGARALGPTTLRRLLKGVGMAQRDCRSGRDADLVVERFLVDVYRVIRSGGRRRKAVSRHR